MFKHKFFMLQRYYIIFIIILYYFNYYYFIVMDDVWDFRVAVVWSSEEWLRMNIFYSGGTRGHYYSGDVLYRISFKQIKI